MDDLMKQKILALLDESQDHDDCDSAAGRLAAGNDGWLR